MADPSRTDVVMNAEAFMEWYDLQPKGRRYELLDGRIIEMQSERATHARTKAACYIALRRAIVSGKLPCEVFPDGMAVRVDAKTIFEPDAMVRCGPRVAGDTVLITDAVIVVEVLSPATQHVDVFRKFNRYLSNLGIVHYIIINSVDKNLVHHRRTEDGRIESAHHQDGTLILDPPGLVLDVESLFAEADA